MAIPEVKNKNQDEESEKTHVETGEISTEIAYEYIEKSVGQAIVIDALKQKIRELEGEFKYFLSQSQSEKKIAENEKAVADRRLSDMTFKIQILRDIGNSRELDEAVTALREDRTAVSVERDMLIDKVSALERRLQQEQENFDTHALLLEEKHEVTIKEKELLHNQVANQNSFMEKLTSENEKLMSHRDLLKNQNLELQEELREVRKRLEELDRQIKVLENSLDQRSNNADNELNEEKNRLQDANNRLKIRYSQLVTDYTQIVDDLRTLKVKYNKFKVDHAKVEARLKSSQGKNEDNEKTIKRTLELSGKISDFNIANCQKRARADSLQSESVLKDEIKQLKSENLALNEKNPYQREFHQRNFIQQEHGITYYNTGFGTKI